MLSYSGITPYNGCGTSATSAILCLICLRLALAQASYLYAWHCLYRCFARSSIVAACFVVVLRRCHAILLTDLGDSRRFVNIYRIASGLYQVQMVIRKVIFCYGYMTNKRTPPVFLETHSHRMHTHTHTYTERERAVTTSSFTSKTGNTRRTCRSWVLNP